MEHFVNIVMEKNNNLTESLDESIFPGNIVTESEQGATVIQIPLPRQLSEDESDEYANRLANYMFENGYEDFDIEISSDEELSEIEETYDGDEFFENYGVMWFNEDEGDGQLPKSPKVLKLVIDDLKKFKAEQEEAKKQGYDEDVRMIQGRIDDMMDIANLIKDGGPIAALDTSVQDLIVDYYEKAGEPLSYAKEGMVDEAEYQGRKVKLGKPMQGDVKKFKVYVKDPKTGNVKKVNFGDPDMKIKKSNPARRRSFRARHNCDNPGPRTKARYWSCRKW